MLIVLLGCLSLGDADGDGVSALMGDCDDGDAGVHPGAEEICNEVDDDCDGTVDGFDAVGSGWFDGDGDGYGTEWLCQPDLDLVGAGGDCNDGDPAVNPGAIEVCNEVDDDCDGIADDGAPVLTWWPDDDGDGYGDLDGPTLQQCEQPIGYAGNSRDCDDAEHDLHPENPWYLDADGDGYGDPAQLVETCTPEPGYVDNDLDCDDARPQVNPDGQEVCDDEDADEDCDGLVEDADDSATDFHTWYLDGDGDGLGDHRVPVDACEAPSGYVDGASDCDDTDAEIGAGSCAIVDIDGSSPNGDPCVLYGDGRVACFGGGSSTWLEEGGRYQSIWGGRNGFGAVRDDGTVSGGCSGALDGSDYVDADGPEESGSRSVCLGLLSDGSLQCEIPESWDIYYEPCPTGLGSGYVKVGTTRMTACAEDEDGYVTCWGYSGLGVSGKVLAWDMRMTGSCAVLEDNSVTCAPSGVLGTDVSCGEGAGQTTCCWVTTDGEIGCTDGDVPEGDDFVVVGTNGGSDNYWRCGGTSSGQLVCAGAANVGDGYATE